ncbi:MAG: 8-amino-7-oxononanoate synthase [Chitinophagaceae bacterium]|nr:8-amino-7-oxononanoate synthase [Chitinophagaceae bacterium]
MNDDFLINKLTERKAGNAFRTLRTANDKIDFCSNDYLGIVKNDLLKSNNIKGNYGSTGSRLLAGNYNLIEEIENFIAQFHEAGSGLIFNSGYDANVGLMSSVPQKGDTILYDQLVHASIRDGIRLSFANAHSFLHNSINDLEKKLEGSSGNIFVVTESVFSMDGDMAPLSQMVALCEKFNAHLIIDEAHATGVIGQNGEGLIQQLQLQHKIFARVHTFGKACGVHGAIVLGSSRLRDYLINFSRPFIFSTALPAISIAAIKASYELFPSLHKEREHLKTLITQIQQPNAIPSSVTLTLKFSNTPIQIATIPGNENVKKIAEKLQQNNLDVRPILYPTIPKGSERLRIVLHAFNTVADVNKLTAILNQ